MRDPAGREAQTPEGNPSTTFKDAKEINFPRALD